MSTVEEIERAVEQLRPPDFARFAAWLERERAEAWDRQIEADAKAGRLDKFIDEALTWACARPSQIQCDRAKLKLTNLSELDQLVHAQSRSG